MIDINFVNPFLAATLNVLKVQASVAAEPGKVYLKKDNEALKGDVSGVIGIVSETFNGSVVISFPEKTFLKVMSGMLGEDIQTLSQDILDGAAEITNMIFGAAKVTLNERGYGIKIALPQVISGKGHSLSTNSKGPTVIIPFTSSAGDFFVEICLSN
jgi:chemotaxis protein CheX